MLKLSLILAILIPLCACSANSINHNQNFGDAINKNLQNQKINNPRSKEDSHVTAQELTPSYDAYQQGRTIQSSSGEKLSAPMSAGNNQ